MRAVSHSAAPAMATTPEARPSSPSIRLMALVTTSTHTTVSGTLNAPSSSAGPNGLVSTGMPNPNTVSVSAAHACTTSLIHGDTLQRSSAMPSARMGSAAHVSPSSGRGSSTSAGPGVSRAAHATSSTPAAIASPPKRGVGVSCTRRASGTSMAPQCSASRRASGVSASVTAAAARARTSEYGISAATRWRPA